MHIAGPLTSGMQEGPGYTVETPALSMRTRRISTIIYYCFACGRPSDIPGYTVETPALSMRTRLCLSKLCRTLDTAGKLASPQVLWKSTFQV